jgi:hypothetical protein
MGFEFADKYVSKTEDIPNVPHWAIIEIQSIFIPGDERSRTNPGHGYPETYESSVSYEVYLTASKWESQIEYREANKSKPYRAIRVLPAEISVTTKVKVVVD